jgi:hypothetical protein
MSEMTCSWGGSYYYPRLDGPAQYEPRCGEPAVVRHREHAGQPWLGRCAKHARALASQIIVEPLSASR